jgi:hypothetical protein
VPAAGGHGIGIDIENRAEDAMHQLTARLRLTAVDGAHADELCVRFYDHMR